MKKRTLLVLILAALLTPIAGWVAMRQGVGVESEPAASESTSWYEPSIAFAGDEEQLAKARRYGPPVGVLLNHRFSGATLETDDIFFVDPKDPNLPNRTLRQSRVDLRGGQEGEFEVGETSFRDSFRLRSQDGSPVRLGDRAYEGWLEVLKISNADGVSFWMLVNRLPIERYLLGVVGNEMPASWPIAALEAQAIAARSYVLYKLALARKKDRSDDDPAVDFSRWHVESTTSDQVYRGVTKTETDRQRIAHKRVLTAVENTRGQVLFYGDKIFDPKFHSTCGGSTMNGTAAFGLPALPVHTSTVCGHCTDSKYHKQWQRSVGESDVRRALSRIVDNHPKIRLGKVKTIVPIEIGRGRHAAYFRIEHAGGSFEVDAIRFRLGIGATKILSTAVQCVARGDEFVFRGSGFGHGVGLCQYGARGLARDEGADSIQILAHYYTSCDVKQLW